MFHFSNSTGDHIFIFILFCFIKNLTWQHCLQFEKEKEKNARFSKNSFAIFSHFFHCLLQFWTASNVLMQFLVSLFEKLVLGFGVFAWFWVMSFLRCFGWSEGWLVKKTLKIEHGPIFTAGLEPTTSLLYISNVSSSIYPGYTHFYFILLDLFYKFLPSLNVKKERKC